MSFVDQFNVKANSLMERFRSMADGKQIINLFTEFNHATLDAIAQVENKINNILYKIFDSIIFKKIAFGKNIDSINQKDPELSKALSNVLRIFQDILKDHFINVSLLEYSFNSFFFSFNNFIKKLKPGKRQDLNEFKRSIHYLRETGREIIEERLRAIQNQEYIQSDILSKILEIWLFCLPELRCW